MKEKIKKIKTRATVIEFLKNRGIYFPQCPSNLQLYFQLRRLRLANEVAHLTKSFVQRELLAAAERVITRG